MGLQKISFKVPPGLWESFSAQAGSLFLSRAPFLNHMISIETRELAADLSGKRLSLRAKRHISGLLKRERPGIPPCLLGIGASGWCPSISQVDTYESQLRPSAPPQ